MESGAVILWQGGQSTSFFSFSIPFNRLW